MTIDPSRYVRPDVSETRVNRLWQNVADRLEKRPARGLRWVVLCTALCAAAAGALLLTRGWLLPAASSERALVADTKLETGGDTLAVTLGDGSSVKLASQSALEVQGNRTASLSLSLRRGQVTCDVTHREGRKFSVVAGDVEVRVIGTKFSVKTTAGDEPRVEVSVLRGVVEVKSRRRPGVVAHVAAGQSWIQNAGRVVAEAAAAPEPPGAQTEPDSSLPAPSRAAAADDAAPKIEPPSAATPPPSAAPSAPSARELFEKAGESRRAGDAAAAARSYEELLRLHPTDGRASLSAFELGRLRMDRLGDPAGAITALERAVALNIGPSFREDALARLVSIYASQGNSAACVRARDRYLSSYPAGVHASTVATRCGSR